MTRESPAPGAGAYVVLWSALLGGATSCSSLGDTFTTPSDPPPAGDPGDPPTRATPAIVSNPVPPGAQAGIAGARVTEASLVAYASLAPGAFPSGELATITNRRTGGVVTGAVVDGGLDPVAIDAETGDTLAFVITAAATPLARFDQVVPGSIAVATVRTEPPAGSRDVPLNLRVRVVFTEPVLPASVPGNLGVERDGIPVEGEAAVSADGLEATFQPADELLGDTDYTLVVDDGVLDTDGTPLAAPLATRFSTGAGSGPLQPDGVIVVSSGNGIEVVRLDGSEPRFLTTYVPLKEYDHSPVWSPDGSRIAFARHRSPWGAAIYVMNADGTALRRISPEFGYDAGPTWSPDGQRIAFENRADSRATIGHLFVMNADGTKRVRITSNAVPNSAPAWSPDGSRIAYVSHEDDGTWQGIFLVNPDGSGRFRLTPGELAGYDPAWSPDGRRLAFAGVGGLFAIDADGSRLEQLTSGLPTADPSWSPDGTMIAFGAYDLCEWACVDPLPPLWVVRVSDLRLYALPETGLWGGHNPSWRP